MDVWNGLNQIFSKGHFPEGTRSFVYERAVCQREFSGPGKSFWAWSGRVPISSSVPRPAPALALAPAIYGLWLGPHATTPVALVRPRLANLPAPPCSTTCMVRRAGWFRHAQQCGPAPKSSRFDGNLRRDHMRNMREAAGRR